MGTPRTRIERALHGTVARPRPFASNAIMCCRRVSTTRPMATMFILADVTNDREGILSDLATGGEIVR